MEALQTEESMVQFLNEKPQILAGKLGTDHDFRTRQPAPFLATIRCQ